MAPTSRSHSGRGRKLGFKTKGRAKPKGNMKRTSRKGAYNKTKKKFAQRRRAPFVESHTRELANISTYGGSSAAIPPPMNPVPLDTIFTGLPLHNLTTMFQVGHRPNMDQSDRMVGTSIYAKYLNTKIQIRFPQNTHIPLIPQSLELIWGWTVPVNATTTTAPAITALVPSDITTHIVQQVSEFMNATNDRLRFISKREQSLQIVGRKKVRPNLQKQFGAPPSAGLTSATTAGTVPDWFYQVNFKINKKLHYDRGGDITSDDPSLTETCYNLNDHRIPFIVLYNPDVPASPGDEIVPKVSYNSILYYSDS